MAGINMLEKLNSDALGGNSKALDELSRIALGGNLEARRMIRQIDEQKIIFKNDEKETKIPKRSDLWQIIRDPIGSLKTKARQIQVSADMAQAPVGSNQEDFPNLGIAEAAALLRRKRKDGGVPFEAWTQRDQKRMEAGLKPKSPPEHPNV